MNPPQGTPEVEVGQDWMQPRRTRLSTTESIIDEHSSFSGTYRAAQNLRIEGRYEGEIECQGTVTIAEQAVVNARIQAENVTVAGQFEGEITCASRFELLPTGRVSGQVTAGLIAVHEGSRFTGQLTRADGRSQRQIFAASQEETDQDEAEPRRSAGPIAVNRRREAG